METSKVLYEMGFPYLALTEHGKAELYRIIELNQLPKKIQSLGKRKRVDK